MSSEKQTASGSGFKKRISYLFFRYYPFTAAGTLYLGVSVYLLGSGFSSKNLYAFLFSVGSLLVLIVLAFFARIQAFRFGHLNISWESSKTAVAGSGDAHQIVRTADVKTFYFFRIHFAMKGILQAGRHAPVYYYREVSASKGSSVRVPFIFPVSGIVDVRCRILLRDVFGFVRAGLGNEERRRVVVHPPLFAIKIPAQFDRSMSMEGSKFKTQSDEEKFIMREYQPGDRLKDINWKASSRIQQLVTKISPQSPEPSKVIEILFRNYGHHKKDSVESVLHLEFLKSWLLSFIAAMQKESKGYRFVVYSSIEPVEVDSPDDMEELSRALALLSYSTRDEYLLPDLPFGELLVFTTMFDTGLAGFMNLHPDAKLRVFRTVKGKRAPACKKLHFFSDFDVSLLPGPWIFRRFTQKAPGIPKGEIQYHEQKLCARW